MNIFANVVFLVLVFFMGYVLGREDGRAAALRMERQARARDHGKLARARAKADVVGAFISEPIAPGGGDE